MPQHLHFTKIAVLSFIISVALHALLIAGVVLLPAKRKETIFPVDIVNLPAETVKKPPLLPKPKPPVPAVPHKPLPIPKTSDKTDILRLPRTGPVPESGENGNEGSIGKEKPLSDDAAPDAKKGGPLPFLSQEDINELARKGHTDDTLGNNSLSEETEAFKFLPYGRSLFAKLNKNLRFPELASITGLQGDVYLIFEIRKDGSLGDITITKSSGYKILDDEVIRTIRDSAPFQPLPQKWNNDRLLVPAIGRFRIFEKNIR